MKYFAQTPFRAVIAVSLLLGLAASAQIVLDAPVRDFQMPGFGESGYRVWLLRGTEGTFVTEEKINVTGMTLLTFSGDASDTLNTTIESPEATILVKAHKAFGKGPITVSSPGYLVEGKDWTWDQKTETIEIKDGVKVTFNQDIDGLLD